MSHAVDPGWGEAIKKVPLALLPTRGMRLAAGSGDGLTVMRVVWITFTFSMVLIGALVVAIDRALPGNGADGRIVGGVVVGIGVFAQVVSTKFVPDIEGASMPAARGTAQRAFFLRVAFAQPSALVGFLGFVVSGNVAVYALGFVVGLAGMFDAAPTSGWIERGQAQLKTSGSDVELLAALTGGGITR
jgi:hypothetical protein